MRNKNTNIWVKPAMAAAVALLAAACSSNTAQTDDALSEKGADLRSVDTTRDTGIRDAILEQHTIYPYHFETDTALLNSLGDRDLAVLADNFRQNGNGVISLRRGDASDELYAARTLAVKNALTQLGVTADNVKIGDDAAAGEGAVGNDVAAILKADAARRDAGSSGSGASGVSGGGSVSPSGAAAAATGGM